MARLSANKRRFCEAQKLLRLSCVDGDGYPRVFPLWFIRKGDDFIVGTENDSAKWRLIRKNPRVGWVIDGGRSVTSYKGVSFWGAAEPITDERTQRRAFRALGIKYFGSTEHPTLVEFFGQPESVFIRLKPERFFSWGL